MRQFYLIDNRLTVTPEGMFSSNAVSIRFWDKHKLRETTIKEPLLEMYDEH